MSACLDVVLDIGMYSGEQYTFYWLYFRDIGIKPEFSSFPIICKAIEICRQVVEPSNFFGAVNSTIEHVVS